MHITQKDDLGKMTSQLWTVYNSHIDDGVFGITKVLSSFKMYSTNNAKGGQGLAKTHQILRAIPPYKLLKP